MKRFLTFLVLLSHLNFSMLLPQMRERDCFDASGQQIDDINSVVEFIDQVVLGNHDSTPEDEDDDNGQQFLIAKTTDLFVHQFTYWDISFKTIKSNNSYPEYIAHFLPVTHSDIISPPPEA